MKNKFLTVLLLGAMMLCFVACEEETPLNRQTFTAKLVTDDLNGATTNISKSVGIYAEEEIVLIVTPTEGMKFNTAPTVTADNATIGLAVKSGKDYTYKLTSFRGNTTVTINGTTFDIDDSRTESGHAAVDLGLPSGLLWATCNVGATYPEDYGNHYAWGETTTKSKYSNSTYTYLSNPTTLPLSADAAHVNWGGNWRMPTEVEITELLNNCTWNWTSKNGTNGYEVIGTNGNSIFLPAASIYDGDLCVYAGAWGFYWSSSLNTSSLDYACNLVFHSGSYVWGSNDRYYGLSVRAVCEAK